MICAFYIRFNAYLTLIFCLLGPQLGLSQAFASLHSERYEAIYHDSPADFFLAVTTVDEAFRNLNSVNQLAQQANELAEYGNRLLEERFKTEKDPEVRAELEARIRVGLHNLPRVVHRMAENQDFACKILRQNEQHILKVAHDLHLDPQLIRAIMFFENAARGGRGIYYLDKIVASFRAMIDVPHSKLPMNINSHLWGPLLGQDNNLSNPYHNIRAAGILLKRLQDLTSGQPLPIETVATLYNHLAATRISWYGHTVKYLYDHNLCPQNQINDEANRPNFPTPFGGSHSAVASDR